MTDNPAQTADTGPLLGLETAPFVYFDSAPTYGVIAGAIQVELTANLVCPTPDGQSTLTKVAWTAHLRCSPYAAAALRDALNGVLAMLALAAAPTTENTDGKFN